MCFIIDDDVFGKINDADTQQINLTPNLPLRNKSLKEKKNVPSQEKSRFLSVPSLVDTLPCIEKR